MNPWPKPDKHYSQLVGIVSKGTIYRTATVLSVWKKDILLDLLKVGESAWDFEVSDFSVSLLSAPTTQGNRMRAMKVIEI